MENHPTKHAKTLIIAAFAAVYLIWGSTYLAILFAIETIPPFFMAAARFFIAGVILLIWALLRGERLPDKKSILKISVSGVLMLAIGNASVGWVEQYLPSGLAAIIVATVPLWFVLLDKKQWKYYFSNTRIIIGLIVGFAGVIILFSGKASGDVFGNKMKLISLIFLLVGCLCWTAGSLYSKYQQTNGSTTIKVAIQMIAASVVIVIIGLGFHETQRFSLAAISWRSLAALAYLITMGSLVAYFSYIWLLSVRPPSLVGTYAYVNPVVAVLLGALVANESVSMGQLIGLSTVIAGLVIVNTSKKTQTARKEKTSETQEALQPAPVSRQ